MLSLDVIEALRIFLSRAQLTGQEVPIFNKAQIALSIEEAEFRATQKRAAETTGEAASQEG